MGDVGEQVVLDLVVQPRADEARQRPRADVDRRGHLEGDVVRRPHAIPKARGAGRVVPRRQHGVHRVAEAGHARRVGPDHGGPGQEQARQDQPEQGVEQQAGQVQQVQRRAPPWIAQPAEQVPPTVELHGERIEHQHHGEDPELGMLVVPAPRWPHGGDLVGGLGEPGHQVAVEIHAGHIGRRVVADDVPVPPRAGRDAQDQRVAEQRERLVPTPTTEGPVVRARVRVRAHGDHPQRGDGGAQHPPGPGCRGEL